MENIQVITTKDTFGLGLIWSNYNFHANKGNYRVGILLGCIIIFIYWGEKINE